MMGRASISDFEPSRATHAFSLIEVVVALGLLAVTVVTVLALQGSIGRSVAEVSDHYRASQLADAIDLELRRLRDLPLPDGRPERLGALSILIPPEGSDHPLRLVAPREGSRVLREAEADDPVNGLPLRDRYYLIEVRQQPAPLAYTPGAGYLAVAVTVKWPFQLAADSSASGAAAADLTQASGLLLNFALTP